MYTKNYDPWAADSVITTACMDNFETIDSQVEAYSHNHDARYYTKATMDSTFWYAGNDGPDSGADFDYIQHGSFFIMHPRFLRWAYRSSLLFYGTAGWTIYPPDGTYAMEKPAQ